MGPVTRVEASFNRGFNVPHRDKLYSLLRKGVIFRPRFTGHRDMEKLRRFSRV